jgi:hemerythrin-like domain-containing protein
MATKTKAAPKDAIALLKQDHEKVRGLLDDLEKTAMRAGGDAESLLEQIEAEHKMHTTIEEEIFYPAFREAASKKEDIKLYYEAVEEHHVVDLVLPEMDAQDAGSPEFAAKAKVLKELVEHHADEEEKEMFPRAKKLMDKDELHTLGEQLAQRKKELKSEAGADSDDETDEDEE